MCSVTLVYSNVNLKRYTYSTSVVIRHQLPLVVACRASLVTLCPNNCCCGKAAEIEACAMCRVILFMLPLFDRYAVPMCTCDGNERVKLQ